MKKKSIINQLFTAALALSVAGTAFAEKTIAVKPVKKPLVQIAILLDTSNSMDGLINQTKSQLWKIVNEFIKAKQGGVAPEVQVALYEYGKSTLSQSSGYIRQIQPLSTDLDKISEDLFALKTNGGDEYCGWVIKNAVAELSWSSDPKVYRAIFIAGNEPFTQGPVPYAESCKAAIAKGIVVNTIHCGTEAEGIAGNWKDGAMLADGKYMVIDQDKAVVHIDAPQDKEIAQLSESLNNTYVAYGASGSVAAARQLAQDRNVKNLPSPEAAVQRAVAKSSANYRNDGWDLVDASKQKDFKLDALKAEELPAELKKMNETERKNFIDGKAKERAELQAKIQSLSGEREKYVAAKMKLVSVTNSLDAVVISTVRDQAQKRNFEFK